MVSSLKKVKINTFNSWIILSNIYDVCLGGFGNTNITLVDELEIDKIIDNFRIPTVPIIFVIGKKIIIFFIFCCLFIKCIKGGPGSGKITHSERISGEMTGWSHICMTEVINTIIKSSGEWGLVCFQLHR